MKEELPADLYQRYKSVERIVNSLKKKKKFKILDVGGFPYYESGYLSEFLPYDETYVLDLDFCQRSGYIQGNALMLPFKKNSFDFVVSMDVLEHIPQEKRERFLEEMMRVSKNYVILGAPFNEKEVQLSEEIVNNFSVIFLGRENPWLVEHMKNVLPDFKATIGYFKKKRWKTFSFPNGYLYNWLFMIVLNHYFESSTDLAELRKKVNILYNKNFFEKDNASPSYRKIIVASKKGKIPQKLKDIFPDKPKSEKKENASFSNIYQLLPKIIELKRREKEKEIEKLKMEMEYMRVDIEEKMENIYLMRQKIGMLENETENKQRETEDKLRELKYIKSTFSYRFYMRIKKFLPFL